MRRVAILAVVAVLSLASCGGVSGDGGAGATASPPAPPTSAAPVYDASTIADRETVGSGLVIGATLAADGTSTLLVDGTLPGDGFGCEGMPLGGLQAQTADGDLTPVLDAAGGFVTSGAWPVFQPGDVGPGARFAVSSMCEKVTSRILVGTIGDDGVPTDLVEVFGPDAVGTTGDVPSFETLHAASLTPDGARLLVIGSPYISEGPLPETTLWDYDIASATWTERTDAPAGVVAAAALADGTLVTLAGEEGRIGDATFDRDDARGLAIAPDGASVAVFGQRGIRVVSVDGSVRPVSGDDVAQLWWAPDGSAVAYPRILADGTGIVVVHLDLASLEASELGATDWGWVALLPDGSGIGVTITDDTGGVDLGLPLAQRWSFALL